MVLFSQSAPLAALVTKSSGDEENYTESIALRVDSMHSVCKSNPVINGMLVFIMQCTLSIISMLDSNSVRYEIFGIS